MIASHDITHDRLLNSFYSRTCPACGERKGEERSLCYRDFKDLPYDLQQALYKRFGKGYEEAMISALTHLKAEKFHDEQHSPWPGSRR